MKNSSNIMKYLSSNIIINPEKSFLKMKNEEGLIGAIIKTFIYGFMCSVLNMPRASEAYNASVFKIFIENEKLVLLSSFIGTIISTYFLLLIGGIIILIFSKICRGTAKYKTCINISASLLIFLPINVLSKYLISGYLYLYLIINLILLSYGALMLYYALTRTLTGIKSSAKAISIIIIIVIALYNVSFLFKPDKPIGQQEDTTKDIIELYDKFKHKKK